MTEDSPYKPPMVEEPVRRWQLRWWFLAGFLLVFFYFLFFTHQLTFSMSGDAVFRCKTWQYYLFELRRSWNSSGAFGPTSSSGGDAVQLLFGHLLISAIAGLLLIGIVKTVRYFRS